MKYYAVVTKLYDNGKVTATMFEDEGDTIPEDKFEECARYDRYEDYVSTEAEAKRMIADAKCA